MADHVGATGLPGEVDVYSDGEALAEAAAAWVAELSAVAVDAHGHCAVALAGGGTPRRLYQCLAGDPWRGRIGWEHWLVFFGDERAVPPDDEQSNYRLAHDTLLRSVDIDARNVHRMEAEDPALDAAAARYARLLETTLPAGPGGAPGLDLVLLGLGENGHTASLFPGTPALEVRDTWATRGLADYAPHDRITLTYPAINASAAVAFLVTGASKGEALRGVRAGTVPAARVEPIDGDVRWFLDEAALRALTG